VKTSNRNPTNMLTAAFKEDKNLLHSDNDWTKTNHYQEQRWRSRKGFWLAQWKNLLTENTKNISCSLFCELCPFWVV